MSWPEDIEYVQHTVLAGNEASRHVLYKVLLVTSIVQSMIHLARARVYIYLISHHYDCIC